MRRHDPLENFSVGPVLDRLLPFQRDAVEHAFNRLFVAPDSTHRFLVADEVGLGKTLIARGVLAKALEHLRDKVKRIDVIYICSNLSIARQNIERLNPLKDHEFSDAERITLLPIHLRHLAKNRVNFVAFTPSTSLELSSSLGTRRERLLLYVLLRDHWKLRGVAALNVLQGAVQDAEGFRGGAETFESEHPVSRELAAAYRQALDAEGLEKSRLGQPSLQTRFEELCENFKRARIDIPKELRIARAGVIGELRTVLARTCIGALEPDLIILDEFQRFKSLLTTETDAGSLAHELFAWSARHESAHVLLLSATPYKAYTLQHELAQEDHYEDFVRTVGFLDNNESTTSSLKSTLSHYQAAMYDLANDGAGSLVELKESMERHLRRVMSRTERLGSAAEYNGMLKVMPDTRLAVDSNDLHAYRRIKRVADQLEVDDAMEYWKSAPYPVNFMERYQLKEALTEALDGRASAELLTALRSAAEHGLDFEAIANYKSIAIPNAKLRQFMSRLEALGAFETLWLAPSLPYYKPGPPFDRIKSGLTKQLLFSAWHMVPKSVCALVSYEAERRAMVADDPVAINTADARKARRGLLRFSQSDGRLTGMPVLTVLYPSRALAELCDPVVGGRENAWSQPALDDVLSWAEERIRVALAQAKIKSASGTAPDESWYWFAPMLLDQLKYPNESATWWKQPRLAAEWGGQEAGADEDDTDSNWGEHVAHAADEVLSGRRPTGAMPTDLPRVLAEIGVAGPATGALRSLLRLYPEAESKDGATPHRLAAARIGWAFRTLFNRPESMALVRNGSRAPYWRRVLSYCSTGCLPSVLDEYLHILRDARGLIAADANKACAAIADSAVDALSVRTATLDVDQLRGESGGGVSIARHSMRTHFAMRFGSDKTEDAKQVQRDRAVMGAFNSPFWPFVMATTSVGQEGLDFHWYCHSVTHWNLPSNPVDLEQREGRVQRFKGLAVRKNVARMHGSDALATTAGDVWRTLFELAAVNPPKGDRGLHPCWLYPLDGGAFIERHIPMYPLSTDEVRLANLMRSLGAYRLVFGQPRQDELLAYLLDHLSVEKIQEMTATLRIELAPPHSSPQA